VVAVAALVAVTAVVAVATLVVVALSELEHEANRPTTTSIMDARIECFFT